ncbi:Zinc-finger homeodomain protein 2 [Glycine max]|nr:hypothetical protein JHK86_055529 [Glycine max]KAG4918260.1 hypothetical protein JHK85_056541 [Glycine max]KAH1189980.1 Zinc-finger homeodomain protein 2 [Glycine max]
MEFKHHEKTELSMPAATASHNDFGIPPSSQGEEEPVAAAIPVAIPVTQTPPTLAQNNDNEKYHECLKNHTVKTGVHTLDGCIKFLPLGEEGTLDALKCLVCNCHRNFHRKETPNDTYLVPYYHHSPLPLVAYYGEQMGYPRVQGQQCTTLALPSRSRGSGGAQSSREDMEAVSDPTSATPHGGSSKKRFRTRFTLEQKEKMLAFAEKLGWRILKNDESVVQEFCAQTSILPHVLKTRSCVMASLPPPYTRVIDSALQQDQSSVQLSSSPTAAPYIPPCGSADQCGGPLLPLRQAQPLRRHLQHTIYTFLTSDPSFIDLL